MISVFITLLVMNLMDLAIKLAVSGLSVRGLEITEMSDISIRMMPTGAI